MSPDKGGFAAPTVGPTLSDLDHARDCFEAREKVMQVAGAGREHGDVAVTCDASRGDGH